MNLDGVTSAVGMLLAAAGADDCRTLVTRVGSPLGSTLRSSRALPPELVEAVLRTGEPNLVRQMFDNPERDDAHREIWQRCATADSPTVAQWWYDRADLVVRRGILAAANPDTPGWTSRSGLVGRLLESSDVEQLRAAVVCAFPSLVEHALRVCHTELSRAEQLRAILSLHESGELGAALGWLGSLALHPDVVELARAAAESPDGAQRLRGATHLASDDVMDTNHLVEELRQLAEQPLKAVAERAKQAVSRRSRWDWEVLRAAHEARPFRPQWLELLVGHPDCPTEIAAHWCTRLPRGLDVLVGTGRPITSAQLRPLIRTVVSKSTLTMLARTRLGEDVTSTDLLAVVQPARTVLHLAQLRAGEAMTEREKTEWDAFRVGLAELVASRLGDDVAAWRLLRTRLPKFNGTVTRLLDEMAAAMARAAGGPGAAAAADPAEEWPDAAALGMSLEPPSLPVNRAAFVTLLDAATTDVQWTLLPHLDERTRYDLLALGQWRAEWLTRAVADGDPRVCVPLARRKGLTPEVIEVLASVDDPATNFGLRHQAQATSRQRHRLANGIPFGAGRSERVPLSPSPQELLSATDPQQSSFGKWDVELLFPFRYHDDPEIARKCVHHFLPPQNRMLRLVIEWWELDGHPKRLLKRLPPNVQQGVHKLVSEAVEAPDPDEALVRLRAAAYELESTQHAIRRLRNGSSLRTLLAEGFRWDWAALVAAHRSKPFDPSTLFGLAALPGCPELLRNAIGPESPQGMAPSLSTAEKRAHRALTEGKSPADVLAKTPVQGWATHAVRCGDLAPVDILRHGHSAREVLGFEPVDDAFRTELAGLVDKHLSGRPEAWLLTLAMLPDFVGTVPELLSTAALAAG
ncbi:hypothetical protein GCM10027290_57180 [Micromonospora sonneratiae]|uniref:DUF4132 domain-containing protein n=1 Tax=Micromonospora sonneratiae TaxID=1184706 RepID=A0ABW3YEJ1_9ACTN